MLKQKLTKFIELERKRFSFHCM